jgi:3-hydroxymyristoyl/3-hydroxydecanoyl-(acyl carrier protein) dehydratase
MEAASLEDELKHCLLSNTAGEAGVVVLNFFYPEGFLGFRGHFPGDPILPGVCILQSLRIGLEQAWQVPLRLVEIVTAKFVSPSRPGDQLVFTTRPGGTEGAVVTMKTKVTRGDERVAEFTVNLERIPVP